MHFTKTCATYIYTYIMLHMYVNYLYIHIHINKYAVSTHIKIYDDF